MIVCHCAVVSCRSVHAAIEQGARTTAAVCRSTGAGQDCGSCIFTVKALVTAHVDRAMELVEAEGAAS